LLFLFEHFDTIVGRIEPPYLGRWHSKWSAIAGIVALGWAW
jgi:hypothetical protein